MSSYTLEELQDKLDKSKALRKKELSSIKIAVQKSEGTMLNTNIRIAIVMLYSHWEGYIKISAREYLKYLNKKNISISKMRDNFRTLSIKSLIKDCYQSNKTEKFHNITKEFLNKNDKIFKVDEKDKLIINTESNLSYEVLKDILFSLGIDNNNYELKENLIKEELLKKRNMIAHGELIELSNKDYENRRSEVIDLIDQIINLMDLFSDDILEQAKNEKYLVEN